MNDAADQSVNRQTRRNGKTNVSLKWYTTFKTVGKRKTSFNIDFSRVTPISARRVSRKFSRDGEVERRCSLVWGSFGDARLKTLRTYLGFKERFLQPLSRNILFTAA